MAVLVRRVVVTGTPGTGKTTLAKALAKKWRVPLVDVNALAKERGFAKKRKGEKELTVDLKRLSQMLTALVRLPPYKKGFVVEGHLACEFSLPNVQRVVVLRTNPRALATRLKRRGYSSLKTRGNVEVEALDYCLTKSLSHYPRSKLVQVDTTQRVTLFAFVRAIQTGKGSQVRWDLRDALLAA